MSRSADSERVIAARYTRRQDYVLMAVQCGLSPEAVVRRAIRRRRLALARGVGPKAIRQSKVDYPFSRYSPWRYLLTLAIKEATWQPEHGRWPGKERPAA